MQAVFSFFYQKMQNMPLLQNDITKNYEKKTLYSVVFNAWLFLFHLYRQVYEQSHF